MNLETVTQRQVELNYRLNTLVGDLETILIKIAGNSFREVEKEALEEAKQGLIEELYYSQQQNESALNLLEDQLKRLVKVTYEPCDNCTE